MPLSNLESLKLQFDVGIRRGCWKLLEAIWIRIFMANLSQPWADLVENVESDVAVLSSGTEPDQDFPCVSVDLGHQQNLSGLFLEVGLVYADRIDPNWHSQHAVRIQLLESSEQVLRDLNLVTVASDKCF